MSVEYVNSFLFDSPCTISLCGSTKSGKSTLLKKLIKYKDVLFKDKPTKVLYCYGIWDKNFDQMHDVEFVKGLPSDIDNLNSEFSRDASSHLLLIFDDLAHELVNSLNIQDLFIRGAHHSNISVIFTSHNLYYHGKYSRTINLNVMYRFLFNNSCDLLQVGIFGGRYGLRNALLFAMKDIDMALYAYIFIDLSPTNKSKIKIKTGIFPGDTTIGYY